MTRGTIGPDWHFKNRAPAGDFGEKTVKWSMGKRDGTGSRKAVPGMERKKQMGGADLGYETT